MNLFIKKRYGMGNVQNAGFAGSTANKSVFHGPRGEKPREPRKTGRFLQAARICIYIAAALMAGAPALYAQGADDAAEEDADGDDGGYIRKEGIRSDWSYGQMYAKGDQTFSISLGTVIPLFFVNHGAGVASGGDMHVNAGGTGSLSYTRFLTRNVFLGGELQGSFASTLAEHFLFFIPVGAKAGYQFVVRRFEFPLSLLAGIAVQQYSVSDSPNYLGLFLRPQAAAYFRYNNDWSFGLNAGWWWAPQWGAHSVDGHFMDITASARYHF